MSGELPTHSEPLLPPSNLLDAGDESEFVDLEMVTEQILADPNLSQHLTRRNEEGQDTVVAYFRCQLQCHQQRYALHVPLHPAMTEVPEVEAIVMDSEVASVRVTDRQRFGLRLEVVLPRPATEDTSVMVEVIAISKTQ